jgi:predicted metal-binding membrane protein
LVGFAIVLVVAWFVTIVESSNFSTLLTTEVSGAAPTSHAQFIALSGVMMLAMMLPSAIPMIGVYRSLVIVDRGAREAALRSSVFAGSYLLLWILFTIGSLLVLAALGLMGSLARPLVFVPGLLLVGAGIYQFTTWKQYCLRHCRTPVGFVMSHWRSGRNGAFRMGMDHATFCIGCCWLLMLVVFVAGAMSILWMGVFSGLVLVEKVWSGGEWFSRVMGGAAVSVGTAVIVLTVGILHLP